MDGSGDGDDDHVNNNKNVEIKQPSSESASASTSTSTTVGVGVPLLKTTPSSLLLSSSDDDKNNSNKSKNKNKNKEAGPNSRNVDRNYDETQAEFIVRRTNAGQQQQRQQQQQTDVHPHSLQAHKSRSAGGGGNGSHPPSTARTATSTTTTASTNRFVRRRRQHASSGGRYGDDNDNQDDDGALPVIQQHRTTTRTTTTTTSPQQKQQLRLTEHPGAPGAARIGDHGRAVSQDIGCVEEDGTAAFVANDDDDYGTIQNEQQQEITTTTNNNATGDSNNNSNARNDVSAGADATPAVLMAYRVDDDDDNHGQQAIIMEGLRMETEGLRFETDELRRELDAERQLRRNLQHIQDNAIEAQSVRIVDNNNVNNQSQSGNNSNTPQQLSKRDDEEEEEDDDDNQQQQEKKKDELGDDDGADSDRRRRNSKLALFVYTSVAVLMIIVVVSILLLVDDDKGTNSSNNNQEDNNGDDVGPSTSPTTTNTGATTTTEATSTTSTSTLLSNGAEFSIDIIQPFNGTSLSLLNNNNNEIVIQGQVSIGLGIPNVSYIYIMDTSTSTEIFGSTSCGSVLDCMKAFFIEFHDRAVSDGSANLVGVVHFNTIVTLAATLQHAIGNNATIINAINSATSGGDTYCIEALDVALGLVTGASNIRASTTVIVFVGDGVCYVDASDASNRLGEAGAIVHSIVIGEDIICPKTTSTIEGRQRHRRRGQVSYVLNNELNVLPQNGGSCFHVPDPATLLLPDLKNDIIGMNITRLELRVDDGNYEDIINNEISHDLPTQHDAVTITFNTTARLMTASRRHEICIRATAQDTLNDTKQVVDCRWVMTDSASTIGLSNGAELSVDIIMPLNGTNTSPGVSKLSIEGEASVGMGIPDVSYIYMIDTSSKMAQDAGSCGTILECVQTFYQGFHQDAIINGSAKLAAVINFDDVDVDIAVTLQESTNPAILDAINAGVASTGGDESTDCVSALDAALGLVVDDANTARTTVVVFASPGPCIEDANEAARRLGDAGAILHVIAIGAVCSEQLQRRQLQYSLLSVSPQSLGLCFDFQAPDSLLGIIDDMIGTKLTSLEMIIDGDSNNAINYVDYADIAGATLPVMGAISVSFRTTAVLEFDERYHEICIRATGEDSLDDIAKQVVACRHVFS